MVDLDEFDIGPGAYQVKATAFAVFEWYERQAEKEDQDWRRPHLGASKIGTECERELWYGWRWAVKPVMGRGDNFEHEGQMRRLLERGEREELWLARDLRRAGVKLKTKDPKTKKQYRVTALGGHFGGSMDGRGRGFKEAPSIEHVWECKTSARIPWNAILKHGVEARKELHYAQMQVYMGLTGLEWAMYFSVNKDNDLIYQARVPFDEDAFKSLMLKAERIVFADKAPMRIKEDEAYATGAIEIPAFYKCNLCDAKDLCHRGHATVEINCRTCAHAIVSEDCWACGLVDLSDPKADPRLSVEAQREGCEKHTLHPDLAERVTQDEIERSFM